MPKFPPTTATKYWSRVRFFEVAHASSNVVVGESDIFGNVKVRNGHRVVVVGSAASGPCCFFALTSETSIPVQDPKTYRQAAEFLGLD